ncbi:hypothetical protein ACLM5H_21970 [Fredinandcohnia humi]
MENRQYLLTVVRYIHQNPVKAGMVNSAENLRWSSCRGYYGKEPYPKDVQDYDYILRMFSLDLHISIERLKEFN